MPEQDSNERNPEDVLRLFPKPLAFGDKTPFDGFRVKE
jgi:hypothetical protein